MEPLGSDLGYERLLRFRVFWHLGFSGFRLQFLSFGASEGMLQSIWGFPKIRGTLSWGTYNKDPTN